MGGIGIGDNGILSADIETLYLSGDGSGEDLCGLEAGFGVELHAPGLLEFFPDGIVVHFLVAGVVRGQGAHVAGTLDVVLSPEGIDPAAAPAHLTRDESQVGEAHDALGTSSVFRHAQAIDDGRLACLRVHPGSFPQTIRIDVADLSHLFRGVVSDQLLKRFEVLCVFGNIFLILKTLFQDHMDQAVDQGDIGTRAELQMDVRLFRQGDIAGVSDDEAGALLHSLTDLHAHHRVCLFRIGAYQENAVHVVSDVVDRVGHRARTQRFCKAGHRRGVAYAGAVVRVVIAKTGPDHLLAHVDIFVGRARAGKARQRLVSVLPADVHESAGRIVNGLIPGSGLEFAGLPVFDQRCAQTVVGVDKIEAAGPALDTHKEMVGGTIGRFHTDDPVSLYYQIHLAAGCAVGAGRADLLHFPFPVAIPALERQCACGTGLGTVAAALAAGVLPAGPEGGLDHMPGARTPAGQGAVDSRPVADTDASLTVDTFSRFVGKIGVIIEKGELFLHLHPGALKTGLPDIIGIAQLLQAADAVARTAHAVHVVIGQNEAEHGAAERGQGIRLRADLHSLCDLCPAGRQHRIQSFRLYHAETAGTDLVDPGHVA